MGADNFRINTTVKKGHMSPLLCSANPINKSNQKVYMNTNIFPYFYTVTKFTLSPSTHFIHFYVIAIGQMILINVRN